MAYTTDKVNAARQGQEDKAKEILARHERLKSDRGNFEQQWQDIKELVRPNAQDFNRQSFAGDQRVLKIFDTTAGKCNRELASGLHSFSCSPTDRWFNLTIGNKYKMTRSPKVRGWLEHASDTIYRHYSKPSANHKTSIHEAMLDLGAFGTAVIYQDIDLKNRSLTFQCFPLASCLISENANGIVDTLYRMVEFSKRQAIQEFGEDNLPQEIKDEKNQDKIFKFCHAVYPREGRDASKKDAKNKKFASCWVSKEYKKIVKEHGFNYFPYHCPRWTKIAGELYGRSPAMDCLPDIKMVNEMKKTLLKSAQKKVDPPLIIDNDGFLLPISTAPGGMIYRDSSEGKVEPLLTGGDIEIGIEILQQPREHIGQCFFVDWMRMQKEDVQMTATEVLDRRDEKLRLMAPMLGRLEGELYSPMLELSYFHLAMLGEIDDPPAELAGERIIIEYVSPAARAQMGSKVTMMNTTLQELAQIAPVAPTVFDRFNFDKYVDVVCELRGVTMEILRSDEELAALRKERKDQEQMAAGADVGGKVAGAVKDLSQAQSFARK